MPGEDVQSWSKAAADNGNADTLINWLEGQARATVNNSARSMMAAHAKDRDLQNGSIVTTGSANAQAFVSGVTYTTVPTGLRVLLKIGVGLTNTASATLNMDGIGAVTVKSQAGTDLISGTLVEGTYVEFLYNGTNWIARPTSSPIPPIARVNAQVFTVGGTYTPTSGMVYCIIECVGGGGGGGSATSNIFGTNFAGGGGGSGGYSRKYATALAIGASQVVTIGVLGAAGFAAGDGGAGGVTSVGSLCIANGGNGGGGCNAGNVHPQPGAGAAPGTGDIAAGGTPGGAGVYIQTTTVRGASGAGGSSYYGGGAISVWALDASFTHGNTATMFGGGGSGGNNNNSPGNTPNGGAGKAGIAIITEFIG